MENEITDLVLLEKLVKIANINGLHLTDLFSRSRKQEKCEVRFAVIEVLFSIDKMKYNHKVLGKMFHRHRSTIYYDIQQSETNRSIDFKCEKIYNIVKEILVL